MDKRPEDNRRMASIIPSTADFEELGKSYSEDGLWNKIKEAGQKAGCKAVYYILILFYALKDGKMSRTDKLKVCAALGYFILPIDITPDALPVIGFTDDVAFLVWTILSITNSITPEVEEKAKEKLRSWFDNADADTLKFW